MRNREEILHTINIALYRNVLIVLLVLNTINIIKGETK